VAPEALRVEELRVRLPGVSSAGAAELVRMVAERVGEGLPDEGTPLALDRLELRVTIPEGASRDAVARAVAAAILERLP
jgi:hypothetical protein